MDNQNHIINWNQLTDNCVSQLTCPVLIDNGKYILFIGKYSDDYGIVMYDVQNDSYPQILKSPHLKNTKLFYHAITFDPKKDVLYLWGGSFHPCFMIYHLNAKLWESIVVQNTAEEIIHAYNVRNVQKNSRVICDVDQTLHAIGGWLSNAHLVFNATREIFEERFVFEQFECISGFGLVSDSINKRLILFGGKDKNECLNTVWFFNLSTNVWTECDFIKWKIPLAYFGFVFLEEIQIVLLFGGRSSLSNSSKIKNNIYILDFNINAFIEISHIKCPLESWFHALLVPGISSQINNCQCVSNVHLFDHNSKRQWCLSLEAILPKKYYKLYCISKNSMTKNNEQNRIQLKKMQEQMREKDAIIKQNTLLISNLSTKQETKEDLMEGNYNLKYMSDEELNRREMSFKTYFFTVVVKKADQYYASFVNNYFNDLEILLEFARMDDSECLFKLCNKCGMEEMHARQLLRRLKQLLVRNTEFVKWFETHDMSKYYDMMLDAGVVTFIMFEETFVSCTDFVECIGMENENPGIFIWRNVPLKRNMNGDGYNIQKKPSVSTPTSMNFKSGVNNEGIENI